MNSIISKGIICIKDIYNIEYRLCELQYKLNKDESFEYTFVPNYSIIDLLPIDVFDTIPGLDLQLRKKEYKRTNIIPTFISERVPNENRQNYYELLKERNMEYMDPIEYLIRSKKRYSGDTLYVIAYEDSVKVEIDIEKLKNNSNDCIRKILIEICKGNIVRIKNAIINDDNRKDIYTILINIYDKNYKQHKQLQKEGIEKAKKKGKYRGRVAIKIDRLELLQAQEDVKKKELTPKQAADKLNISIDKYYRELKKLHK